MSRNLNVMSDNMNVISRNTPLSYEECQLQESLLLQVGLLLLTLLCSG